MKDLIIKINSEVITQNATEFAKDVDVYLETLPQELKTDGDFGLAETEIKNIKAIEVKAKQTLSDVINGNADVEMIISTANEAMEKLRKTRLNYEKLVKAEKEKRKHAII